MKRNQREMIKKKNHDKLTDDGSPESKDGVRRKSEGHNHVSDAENHCKKDTKKETLQASITVEIK